MCLCSSDLYIYWLITHAASECPTYPLADITFKPVHVREAWFPPDGIQICTLFNQLARSRYKSKLLNPGKEPSYKWCDKIRDKHFTRLWHFSIYSGLSSRSNGPQWRDFPENVFQSDHLWKLREHLRHVVVSQLTLPIVALFLTWSLTSPQPGRLLPTRRDHFLYPGSTACFLTSIWISANCRGTSRWKQTEFAYSECSPLKSGVVVITSECSGVLVSGFVVVLVVKGDILTNKTQGGENISVRLCGRCLGMLKVDSIHITAPGLWHVKTC